MLRQDDGVVVWCRRTMVLCPDDHRLCAAAGRACCCGQTSLLLWPDEPGLVARDDPVLWQDDPGSSEEPERSRSGAGAAGKNKPS